MTLPTTPSASAFFEAEEDTIGARERERGDDEMDAEDGDELAERAIEEDCGARRVERQQQRNPSKRATPSSVTEC